MNDTSAVQYGQCARSNKDIVNVHRLRPRRKIARGSERLNEAKLRNYGFPYCAWFLLSLLFGTSGALGPHSDEVLLLFHS